MLFDLIRVFPLLLVAGTQVRRMLKLILLVPRSVKLRNTLILFIQRFAFIRKLILQSLYLLFNLHIAGWHSKVVVGLEKLFSTLEVRSLVNI